MDALGSGGLWWLSPPGGHIPRRRRPRPSSSSSSASESINIHGGSKWSLSDFPLRQAAIAASLTSTGDAIAQIRDRLVSAGYGDNKDITSTLLSNHNWSRTLRMASYGFLLYGPGSYAWYQFLDKCMPKQTFISLSVKVLLNQIVLSPIIIGVVFAWNNLWLGKLSQLPSKYQKDAIPTLLYGFKFWVPVCILNFGLVPLAAQVAFMSTCSIFWNFYLSTTMSN